MRILYIVVGKDAKGTPEFEKSMKELCAKEDKWIYAIEEPDQLYFKLQKYVEKEFNETDYVCLVPINSQINPDYKKFLLEYKVTETFEWKGTEVEKRVVYLPLVVLTNTKTKGVLNNCVWSPNLATEPGVLDHELATKQVDTTLYGALIPRNEFFDGANYNEEVKYYQHFHFLNSFSKRDFNLVVGIPKTLLFTDIDMSLSEVSQEEKIKNFKLSKAAYATN